MLTPPASRTSFPSCDRPRLLHRGRNTAGHERVASPAALRNPFLPTMGHDEDRRVEWRVLAPVRIAEVKHRSAYYLRAEPGEVVSPHPRVHRVLAAVHALFLTPAAQRKLPAKNGGEERHAARVGRLRTRDAVQ